MEKFFSHHDWGIARGMFHRGEVSQNTADRLIYVQYYQDSVSMAEKRWARDLIEKYKQQFPNV